MHYLPPKIPSACSSMFSKSRLPGHKKQAADTSYKSSDRLLRDEHLNSVWRLPGAPSWVCTCQGVDPILAGAVVSLGVALIKLTLENTQQA